MRTLTKLKAIQSETLSHKQNKKIKDLRLKEMAQALGALAGLLEDPRPVPGIHTG